MQELELKVERSGTRSTTTFDLPCTTERAIEAVRIVDDNVTRFHLVSVSSEAATLSTGVTWRAWGGIITLNFAATEDAHVRVTATWAPALSVTLVEWGQGRKDLIELHRELLLVTT